MFMYLFNEKLKQLRQSNNMTQEELAKKISVSRSAVVKWEQDRSYPNIETLQLIADVFNVSIDELSSDKKITINKGYNTKKNVFIKKIIYNFRFNIAFTNNFNRYFYYYISSKKNISLY